MYYIWQYLYMLFILQYKNMGMIKMSINKFLYDETWQCSYKYGLNADELKDFLIPTDLNKLTEYELFIRRSEQAIKLVKSIMVSHGKDKICAHIADLAKYESNNNNLKPKHRDHVVHTIFTFILGIYINENYMKNLDACVNPFQWKTACLFHDIGYLGNDSINSPKFEKKVNKIKHDYVIETAPSLNNHQNVIDAVDSTTKVIPFKISGERLGELTNSKNSLKLIQNYFNFSPEIDLNKEYLDLNDKKMLHHGMIGSLAVLSIIDLMYYTNNPSRKCKPRIVDKKESKTDFNQQYFDEELIPACSAIYIHSHDSEWFKKHNKINCSKTPVAFLLRLSDCLQEWDRPSGKNGDGLSSDYFEIGFNGSDLIFNINIPNDTKKDKVIKKIEHEISCLECLSVKIL